MIRKIFKSQEDWYNISDSVLFAIHISKHSSTGVSPYRMVYNKDPILPFEYADRSDNLTHEHNGLHKSCDNIQSSESSDDVDPISKLLERLEKQRENTFQGEAKNILSAQKHQAKWYNIRNGAGEPFEVGTKVFKRCMKNLSQKQKMYKKNDRALYNNGLI